MNEGTTMKRQAVRERERVCVKMPLELSVSRLHKAVARITSEQESMLKRPQLNLGRTLDNDVCLPSICYLCLKEGILEKGKVISLNLC